MKPERKAFTLIELLVVIAIIGILMALLFPAVQSAMDAAKKTSAKNDLMQTKTAITSFYTEYSRYPDLGGSGGDTRVENQADNAKLMNILRYVKSNADAEAQNPRGINYIQPKQHLGSGDPKGAIGSNGAYYDPWGELYKFEYDSNYDNVVGESLPYTDAPSGGFSASIIGWSFGKDKEVGRKGNGKSGGSDDAYTW